MPAALAVVATDAAIAVSTAVATIAPASVSTALAIVAYQATSFIVTAGITLGLSYAASSLLAPKPPKPEDGKVPFRQALPPRQRGYGRARIGGPYMCYEVSGGTSVDVLAAHDGQIDGWERYYLTEDEVQVQAGAVQQLNPGNHYNPSGNIKFLTRTGLPTETAYAEVSSALPGIWTAQHRGDGIASFALLCPQSKTQYQQKDYPKGLPQPSALGRLQRVWDWRDGSQTMADPTTWKWSENPILQLAHFLCFDTEGVGFDPAVRLLPTLSYWTRAADVCEQQFALKGGGTEDRYRSGGIYRLDNEPADVIKLMLDACDGWLGERGDGALVVDAGEYVAPTVTISGAHILDYSIPRFVADEEAVNELVVSFNDPDTQYTTTEADPWRDEADIAIRGRTRSQRADLSWVQSHSQARRLAKRIVTRATAERRGWVRCDLYGLLGLGERYLNLVIDDLPSLAAGISVEVTKLDLDLARASVTISFVMVGPSIDEWDPATEEGRAPSSPDRPVNEAPAAPVNVNVAPLFGSVSSAGSSVQLQVSFDAPQRTDLTFRVRYKPSGAADSAWSTQSFDPSYAGSETNPNARITVTTGYVTLGAELDVEVASVAGGNTTSDWSAVFEVRGGVSSGGGTAGEPGTPIGVTAVGGQGQATISWTQPSSADCAQAFVYRTPQGGPTPGAVIQGATIISGGPGAALSYVDTGVSPGSYSYTVEAATSGGQGGPGSALATCTVT